MALSSPWKDGLPVSFSQFREPWAPHGAWCISGCEWVICDGGPLLARGGSGSFVRVCVYGRIDWEADCVCKLAPSCRRR